MEQLSSQEKPSVKNNMKRGADGDSAPCMAKKKAQEDSCLCSKCLKSLQMSPMEQINRNIMWDLNFEKKCLSSMFSDYFS